MPKYDSTIQDLTQKLASAKRILVALPTQFNVDKLGAALALSLVLRNSGKQVEVVSSGTPTVGLSNLFGIGDVKDKVSTSGEGNFIIKLDGVVDSSGQLNQVPSLEKLDWFPKDSSLNMVFHVIPGQRFEPTNVSYFHENSGYDLVFVVGASSMNDLGPIYSGYSAIFDQSTSINIDNSQTNANFGKINIVDSASPSISEMVAHLLPSLGLNLDSDSASNILAGIYEATQNMTQNVSQDTSAAVGQATQAGGQPPVTAQTQQLPVQEGINTISFNPQPAPVVPVQPPQPEVTQNQPIQPVVPFSEPVPVQSAAVAPANDLLNNPFLNPNQSVFQGPGFGVSPAPVSQPTPAFAPTFDNQPAQQYRGTQQPVSQPYTQVSPQPQPVMSQPQPVPVQPESVQMPAIPQAQPGDSTYDLRQIFQVPQMPEEPTRANSKHAVLPTDNFKPAIQQPEPQPVQQTAQQQSSQEEVPMREMTGSINPEMDSSPTPDWLVPKIFKSGSLG